MSHYDIPAWQIGTQALDLGRRHGTNTHLRHQVQVRPGGEREGGRGRKRIFKNLENVNLKIFKIPFSAPPPPSSLPLALLPGRYVYILGANKKVK